MSLRAPSETWQVWSTGSDDPAEVGDIGFISVDPTISGNFQVALVNGFDSEVAGARDVLGIAMLPSGADTWSGVSGEIAGSVLGDIVIDGGDGTEDGYLGDVSLTVNGSVMGDIIAPRVRLLDVRGVVTGTIEIDDVRPFGSVTIRQGPAGGLDIGRISAFANVTVGDGTFSDNAPSIGGGGVLIGPIHVVDILNRATLKVWDHLHANLTISGRILGGALEVAGRVDYGVTVRIAKLTWFQHIATASFGAGAIPGLTPPQPFVGLLVLENGIPLGASVKLWGVLVGDPTINPEARKLTNGITLNGQDIGGTLDLGGGHGTLLAGAV